MFFAKTSLLRCIVIRHLKPVFCNSMSICSFQWPEVWIRWKLRSTFWYSVKRSKHLPSRHTLRTATSRTEICLCSSSDVQDWIQERRIWKTNCHVGTVKKDRANFAIVAYVASHCCSCFVFLEMAKRKKNTKMSPVVSSSYQFLHSLSFGLWIWMTRIVEWTDQQREWVNRSTKAKLLLLWKG